MKYPVSRTGQIEVETNEVKVAYSYSRFSTKEQKQGDSLRRQNEAAEKWCKEHKCILSKERFSDEGRSAFKGKHLDGEGDLKRFLSLVEQGKIVPGSVLILENFDRLSRLPVSKSVNLFLNVINSGIGMVFTMTFEKRLITADVVDREPYILFQIVGEAMRSHHESKYKGGRVRDARNKEKQDAAATKKAVYKWTPPWCDFVDGKYVPNEHVKTVRRIFKEYLGGNGAFRIAKKFNDEKVPLMGRSATQWYKKIVRDTLLDGRVIGRADFLNVSDYFPKVVDETTFNKVQSRLASQAAAEPTGGPVANVRNLFTSICRCGKCGGVMAYGETKKRYKTKTTTYTYLVCDNSKSGKNCTYKSIPYQFIEGSFIDLLNQPKFFNTLQDGNDKASELKAMHGELAAVNRQIEKFTKMFEEEDNPPKSLVARLRELERKASELKQRIKVSSASTERSVDFSDWMSEMRNQWTDNLTKPEFRLKLRDYIRGEIKSITIDEKENVYRVDWKNGNAASVLWWKSGKSDFAFQIFAGHEKPVFDKKRVIFS